MKKRKKINLLDLKDGDIAMEGCILGKTLLVGKFVMRGTIDIDSPATKFDNDDKALVAEVILYKVSGKSICIALDGTSELLGEVANPSLTSPQKMVPLISVLHDFPKGQSLSLVHLFETRSNGSKLKFSTF